MRRADRLLQIVQIMRRQRGVLTAQAIAEELEVTKRTVYRDIAHLQANGVPIEGEAGLGYVLQSGFDLPPLMFTVEEVETIALAMRMMAARGDAGLRRSSDDVLAKVRAVLPESRAKTLDDTQLIALASPTADTGLDERLALLRRSIREHQILNAQYINLEGQVSERQIWPLLLTYYSHVTLLGAWCETRGDFRTFRVDRFVRLAPEGRKFNPKGGRLLRAYEER